MLGAPPSVIQHIALQFEGDVVEHHHENRAADTANANDNEQQRCLRLSEVTDIQLTELAEEVAEKFSLGNLTPLQFMRKFSNQIFVVV